MSIRAYVIVFGVVAAGIGGAQSPETPRVRLSTDQLKAIETPVSPLLSRDGRWLAVVGSPVEGSDRLIVRSNDAAEFWVTQDAGQHRFTDDSKFVLYVISPPTAVQNRLRAERKPIPRRLGIRELSTGTERFIDQIEGYEVLKGGQTIIVRKARAGEATPPRQEVLILRLSDGQQLRIGNVGDIVAHENGTRVAFRIVGDHGERAVQVLDPATFRLVTVFEGKQEPVALDWAKDADALAFLLGEPREGKVGHFHALKVVRDPFGERRLLRWVPGVDQGLPDGHRISENGGLALSPDGTRVAFGIAPWQTARPVGNPAEVANVEIWNARDLRVVPEQRVTLDADRRRVQRTVWTVGSPKLQILQATEWQSVSISPDFRYALVRDELPYRRAVNNGWTEFDVRLVDLTAGDTKEVAKQTPFAPVPSRDGKYIALFRRGQWSIYEIASGRTTAITTGLGQTFENPLIDTLQPERFPVAPAMWLKNDAGVVLHDEFDAYLWRPGQTVAARLTNGRRERIRHTFTDPVNEPEGYDVKSPLFFRILKTDTKASGYARVLPDGTYQPLIFDDRLIAGLQQAPGTDRVVFSMQRAQDSPQLFVSNTGFTAAKPVTNFNPQLRNAAWGKSELVSFRSRWGLSLHGVLIYPAEYDPNRRYPMVTYIYERLSDSLHQFVRPLEWSAYNEQILSQNGYFVFKPDIAYRPKSQPGVDALDCLEPAIAAVFAKRVGVDPDRVGLIGHSWGGYQTAFVTTVSKRFRVGVAGAPLTELTSMYNLNYWNTGTPNQEIFETSQGRFAKPFWEMPENYFENSPVWRAAERTAPLLMMFGDSDGAVDYRQGTMFYNTLRRMGKDCVLLVYPGENHGLVRRPNQLDYARRLRHFLDVYLKGTKPETWITDGQPLIVGRE